MSAMVSWEACSGLVGTFVGMKPELSSCDWRSVAWSSPRRSCATGSSPACRATTQGQLTRIGMGIATVGTGGVSHCVPAWNRVRAITARDLLPNHKRIRQPEGWTNVGVTVSPRLGVSMTAPKFRENGTRTQDCGVFADDRAL